MSTRNRWPFDDCVILLVKTGTDLQLQKNFKNLVIPTSTKYSEGSKHWTLW